MLARRHALNLVTLVVSVPLYAVPCLGAAKTCLTGSDPSAAADAAQINAVRSLIDATCVCTNFDGSQGKAHSDYVKCAATIIKAQVAASPGKLRSQCTGTVTKFYAQSTCGMNPAVHAVPCIKTVTKSGRVSCAIKATTKKDGVTASGQCTNGRTFTQVACPVYTTCLGAADTNGNLIIGAPGDTGLCDDCHATPQAMTTPAGVSFLRTPESCFAGISDFPYPSKYVALDGLRQAYIDEGPPSADPILLLHGQPSWSYLYRKMIPVLVSAGHRVLAMDHLGMGRSDKPTDINAYSYLGHADRMARFIQTLGLSNITLFCQDWGSLIGLHVAGEHTDWFGRIVVGDGTLPVFPAGIMIVPTITNPDTPDPTVPNPFAGVPAQQVPIYDACGNPLPFAQEFSFPEWANYAMRNPGFHAAEVVEAATWFPLPAGASAAYDAPFPRREYMAGARVFPYLINQVGGTNQTAWAGLQGFTKPFLTIWSSNDPVLGSFATQQNFIDNVPGAKGQPHTRLANCSHFLQDDQGVQIATIVNEWIAGNAPPGNFPPDACAGAAGRVDGGSP